MDYSTRPVDYDPFTQSEDETEQVVRRTTEPLAPTVAPLRDEPAPAGPTPPVARQGGFATRPVDYDPFATPKEAAPDTGMLPVTAFTRGVVSGTMDTRRMFGEAVEATRVAMDPSFVPDMSEPAKTGFERQVPGIEDVDWDFQNDPVGTADRALTWFGETLGSTLAQMAPTAATAVVTKGKLAPMTVAIVQNYGDVWSGFKQDKDIQAAIASGRISHQTAAQIAAATGVAVGSLDAFSIDRLLSITGLKKAGAIEAAKAAGKRAVLAAAAKGAGFESTTEALQSVIAQGAEVGLGAPEAIAWAERGLRTLNEFLAGAVGGGAAGGGVAVLTRPKKGEEDEETVGAAQPTVPEPGVEVPPEATGQATPGGTGVSAPPPPGAPATAAAPAPAPAAPVARPSRRKPTVVVPDGQVAPDIAAATVAPAPVAAAPAPVAPVEEDTEDIYDEDIVEDEGAALTDVLEAQRRMEEIIRNVSQAPIDKSIASALAAGAAPMPEPAGTIEAQQRREAPQPALVPPPPVAAPASPAGVAQQEPATVIPPAPVSAPPVAAFAQAPVDAQQPQEAVSVQPAPQTALVTAPVAAPGEITTRPVDYDPFAGAAPLNLVGEQLAQRIRQEMMLSQERPEITGHPDREEVIRQVALESTREFEGGARGISPARVLEERLDMALAEVGGRLNERIQAAAKAEEAKTEAAFRQAGETMKAARVEGTPQERARAGVRKGKTAEEIARQSPWAWNRLAKKELEKPEAERAPELVEYARLRDERKKVTKKDEILAVTLRIERQQQLYAERVGTEEKVKLPPREPKEPEQLPPPVPREPGKAAVRKSTAVAKKELSPEERRAQRAARNAKLDAAIGQVLADTPIPDLSRATSSSLRELRKTMIPGFVNRLDMALKTQGVELRDEMSFAHNTPEENLAIFAHRLKGRKDEYPGQGVSEFWQALKYLQSYRDGNEEDLANLKGLISNEAIDARELSAAQEGGLVVAPENTEGTSEVFWSDDAMELPLVKLKLPEVQPHYGGSSGSPIQVDATARTGMQVLRQATKDLRELTGFSRNFYRLISIQLRRMVGNVNVYFVSETDIRRLRRDGSNAAGFYRFAPPINIASGERPVIYINMDNYAILKPVDRAELIIHEMTHAATSFAMMNNLRGSAVIGEILMNSFKQIVLDTYGNIPANINYAFTNEREFLAETFSNQHLNSLLKTTLIPERVLATIHGVRAISVQPVRPSYWDMIVNWVANAIAPTWIRDTRQMNYLSAIIDATPIMMLTSAEQVQEAETIALGQQRARDKARVERANRHLNMANREQVRTWLEARRAARAARKAGAEEARHPQDAMPIMRDVESAVQGVQYAAENSGGWFSRKALKVMTTEEMKRRSVRFFGEGPNVFTRLADVFLNSAPLRRKYQEEGHKVTAVLARYYAKDKEHFLELSDVMHDATLAQLDLSAPLASPANAHISKKGDRDEHRRAAYARLKPRWDALPQEAKDAGLKVVAHYRDMENLRIEKTVSNMLQAALQPVPGGLGVKLPPGESLDTAIRWVLDGGIDKPVAKDPANVQPNERSASDIAMHAALGRTAVSLKGVRELRKIKGWYVPLMRWGQYFFTATEKIPAPAGATVDTSRTDGTHFIFKDKKDMRAYQASGRDQVDRVIVEHYEPGTDKRMQAQDIKTNAAGVLVIPEKRYRVVVQNRVMEMHDSMAELKALAKTYKAAGYTVAAVARLDTAMHRGSEILPAHINRMLASVEQSMAGNTTAAQKSVQAGIVAAYIRQQAGSASHRRLKRRSVRGFSRDFLHATNTANETMAGHLAALDIAPKAAVLEREAQAFITSGRHAGKGETIPRQNYLEELRVRMTAAQTRVEQHAGHRLASAVMELSFVTHLMSPAYSIINAMQPTITWAVLSARFGAGAAGKEIGRALVDLNAGRIYRSGIAETGREARHGFDALPRTARNYDTLIRGIIGTREPGFLRVMDRMLDLGYGASSGIEAPEATEIGRNKAEIYIGRLTRVARALPEAVEAANRYVTALATYRLAKRAGLSDDKSVDLATTTVEQTQGGYAAENNPAYMSGRWTRVPLQFKKYALMYGQLYWGSIHQALRGADRETRVHAAKSLASLSAVTMVFAGVGGLPMMEVARLFVTIASGFGLTDDDWDDWENSLQDYYKSALEWAGSGRPAAEFYAEMMARGLTRVIGIDTSARMGNDSMILFGEPRSMVEADVKSWILDLVIGAPGGMVSDSLQAISDLASGEEQDWGKILPFPKMMKDIHKAYQQHSEGFQTKAGRQVAPPITTGEAIAQGVGFRPASVARQWETKGSGARYAANKRIMDRRVKVMGRWANASPAERQEVWRTVIREWNRDNPSRQHRIDMSDLRRSLATRRANTRREKREASQ